MKTKRLSLDELIDREARELAMRHLESELEKDGLPLPKDSALDLHIEQLLTLNPEIRDRARSRVIAAQDAYSESLKAIGLPAPDLPIPVDIGEL